MKETCIYNTRGDRRFSVRQRADGLFEYVEEYFYINEDVPLCGWSSHSAYGIYESLEIAAREATAMKHLLERPAIE